MQRVVFAALLLAQSAAAQQTQQPQSATQKQIPIRQLGPITAVAKDTLGPRLVLRALSNGSVLVGVFPLAPVVRRVVLFDSTLQHSTVVRDSANAPQLIGYTGDSTLALDNSSGTLLVLDQLGKVARAMAAPPRQTDLQALQVGFTQRPSVDAQGRLIYRGAMPPRPRNPALAPTGPTTTSQPDSAPIVRADFDTRKIDTLGMVKDVRAIMNSRTEEGQNLTFTQIYNVMATADEWAMLSDGTLAIVRAQDYHIDWVDPDGTRRSTPKMPFDWKRITDAEKQAMIDTMNTRLDSVRARNPQRTVQGPNGPSKTIRLFEVAPLSTIPDYEPPISPLSVQPDLDGNLWIVPRTSVAAKGGGILYDVINRKGEITERVQVPAGVAIIGFGPGGVVYLNRVVGSYGFLERARVR
jgi:hypothetical protein